MFRFVPPWMEPTVITAGSSADVSRLTIFCRARTISDATTTGSFVRSGVAPCPPTPRTVMSTRRDWPVAGTTGYDFLNRVNSVFVDQFAEPPMSALYVDLGLAGAGDAGRDHNLPRVAA